MNRVRRSTIAPRFKDVLAGWRYSRAKDIAGDCKLQAEGKDTPQTEADRFRSVNLIFLSLKEMAKVIDNTYQHPDPNHQTGSDFSPQGDISNRDFQIVF